ncbi:34377_t:CDS:2 [Gigaspora margarita]|uniref:34377_t:CDS:1 n=1 Tax=Gigaspora margarita TaxID=4874 RepID=A0ABN7VLS7_GIGMA|nr:34377_t:CDS:2 [Gigaspora margarita]
MALISTTSSTFNNFIVEDNVLPPKTKQNIHDEWEMKISMLKKILFEVLGEHYDFVVNFAIIYDEITNAKSQYTHYYINELGARVFNYFNELVRNIDHIARRDSWIRQKILDLTKSRRIYLLTNIMYSWRDEAVKIKDNCIVLCADPSYFGGYFSTGYSIFDIINSPSIMDKSILLPGAVTLEERKKRITTCKCGEQFSSQNQWFGHGGHGNIHMAHWVNGDIRRWDCENHRWERFPGFAVALKTLYNSQNLSAEFLNEIKAMHKCAYEKLTHVVSVYGISQNPYTKEYILVTEFMDRGNMRDYLRDNSIDLSWNTRLKILLGITTGLMNIHNNELIHCDFHSGNLLFESTKGGTAFIGDLGFRPPIPDGIPIDYVQLINLCWDNKPHNRPSVEEIRKIVDYLYCETKNSQSEIGARFSDADKRCKNFQESNFKIHPHAIYTSRPLSKYMSECISLIDSEQIELSFALNFKQENQSFH